MSEAAQIGRIALFLPNPGWRRCLAGNQSSMRIELKNNVADMPELMAWADMAVSAGGTTCWEPAFMGLPNLIVVLADNQRERG